MPYRTPHRVILWMKPWKWDFPFLGILNPKEPGGIHWEWRCSCGQVNEAWDLPTKPPEPNIIPLWMVCEACGTMFRSNPMFDGLDFGPEVLSQDLRA